MDKQQPPMVCPHSEEGRPHYRWADHCPTCDENPMASPPVRPCCGKRHWGAICPDGKIQCCICWERCDRSELNVVDGIVENVCKECAEHERLFIEKTMQGAFLNLGKAVSDLVSTVGRCLPFKSLKRK